MSNYRNSRYPVSEHVPIEALHTPSNRLVRVCSAPDCETEDGDFIQWPCPTVRTLDWTDVLPYAITCETCGCHEEGEHHRSVVAPTLCVECRD